MLSFQNLRSSALSKSFQQFRCSTTKARPKLLGRYDKIYRDLFRVNATSKVVLRDWHAQNKLGRSSYDLKVHEDGLVHPAASENFEGPNGASLRPNSPFLQEVIRGFKGKGVSIYRLKEGTPLPEDLVLLHEHTDHHSLQCKRPMKLEELNKIITDFCQQKGEKMTKKEFVERYPFDSCEIF